jgi:hypothetical protein
MDDYDYEAMATAAEQEAPYSLRLRIKLALIRLVGWIAQKLGLAVIVALIVLALPAVVSADGPHQYVSPWGRTVLGGNAPGTVYCPAGCGRYYAYTGRANTVTIMSEAPAGMVYKTSFRPSAGRDYVTRNVFSEAEAAGASPIQAASAARGYPTLAGARSAAAGWSFGGGAGGEQLDK